MDKIQKLRHTGVTVLGALIGIFGILSAPDILNLLPPKVGHGILVVGGGLTMVGRSLLAPTAKPPADGSEG